MNPTCNHCEKDAVMQIDMGKNWFDIINYYCEDHIPVGFNGIIPTEDEYKVKEI